jgi:hypothetical protein
VGYSTYLGGSSWEESLGIAVDSAGSAYVTGTTWAETFPTTSGAFDENFNGFGDAFVTKINATGSALVYSTYLGGTDFDYGEGGIAVDSAGNAYVTGTTYSGDFPTTPGAFDTSYDYESDLAEIFVTKLNAAGSALGYSTYVGGSSKDLSWGGITVDSAGSAYITGQTLSPNFPTTPNAFDTTYNSDGKEDAFVTKLEPAGSALVYSTYLGGLEWDRGWGIAVDSAGHAYVSGYTISINFPTTEGAFDPSKNGGHDRYVTKLNIDGSAQVYSTFLGGSTTESGWGGIAVDSAGSAYVVTPTASNDFPTTAGAFDTSHNGFWDVAVTKFNAAGSALIYSTFVGGANLDYPYDMALDSAGSVYVSGETTSTNYPTTAGAFDTSYNGGTSDAFLTKLNGAGSALAYSTYLGGSDWDVGNSIATGAGSAYITGRAYSADFPTTAGAFDTSFNGGGSDAFVTRISFTAKTAVIARAVQTP